MAYFRENYGVRSLVFVDDNLLAARPRAMEIFRGMVDRNLKMPWKANAIAVFRLDEFLLDAMAESGCQYICVAIESGSPRVLRDIINKPVDLGQARRMTEAAQSRGIFVAANFMVGFPGETWNEIRQTLRFAEELGADYCKIFSPIPLRHTRLWELCEDGGAFAPGFDPNRVSWNKGQITSPHFDDRELTLLRAYEWDRINFSSPERIARTAAMMGIEVDELERIRKDTRKLALDRIAEVVF
jgi:MoaA/NifB/PqqE/SkfB family radical SAM enzyme